MKWNIYISFLLFVAKQQMLKVVRGINFHEDWQATIKKQVKGKFQKLNSHYKYRNFHQNINKEIRILLTNQSII